MTGGWKGEKGETGTKGTEDIQNKQRVHKHNNVGNVAKRSVEKSNAGNVENIIARRKYENTSIWVLGRLGGVKKGDIVAIMTKKNDDPNW